MSITILIAVLVSIAVALLVVAWVLLYRKDKAVAKKLLLAVVIEAENRFGASTGNIKYAYVVGLIWPKLPVLIKLFISQVTLGNWIEDAVTEMKKKLGEVNVQQAGLTIPITVKPITPAAPTSENSETAANSDSDGASVDSGVAVSRAVQSSTEANVKQS